MTKGNRKKARTIKIVAVGPKNVGKTTLLVAYRNGKCPEYLPLIYNTTPIPGDLNDKPYELCLCDTPGGEEYKRLRPLSYFHSDVFILLFDVTADDDRIEEIHSYYYVEINRYWPNAPIILVGSKIDLRDKEGTKTITTEKGQALAKQIGAAKYMEISTLDYRGVAELFQEVIILGFGHSSSRGKIKKKCTIL